MKNKGFNIIFVIITVIATSITFTFKSESLTITHRSIILLCLLCALFGSIALRYYILYFQVKLTVDSLDDKLNDYKDQLKNLSTDNQKVENRLSKTESEISSLTDEIKLLEEKSKNK